MRLILRCPDCRRHSVVRVKGLLRPRIVTKASVAKEVDSKLSGQSLTFPKCKVCGKATSKAGNLTNMVLVEIEDPGRVDDEYGMMCAEHAGELTDRIVSEKRLSESELQEAMARAHELMLTDLQASL